MEKTETNRYSWIDSLKGIAILGVLFTHCGAESLPGILGVLGFVGRNGVQLFFLLSAFLAFTSLEHYFAETKYSFKNICCWWLKKAIRIIPIFYLVLIISLFFEPNSYWLGVLNSVTASNILTHISLTFGLFPHFINSIIGDEWYLGTLIIFYLLAPFLFKKIKTFSKSITLFLISAPLCSIICHFSNVYLVPNSSDAYLITHYYGTFWIFAQFPVLSLGIVLYFILKLCYSNDITCPPVFSYSIIIFALIMLWGNANAKNCIYGLNNYTLYGIWFFMLAIGLYYKRVSILDNAVFAFLGKHSYSIYLIHLCFISIFDKFCLLSFPTNLIVITRFSFVTVSSLVFAVVAEKYVETPVSSKLRLYLKKLIVNGV